MFKPSLIAITLLFASAVQAQDITGFYEAVEAFQSAHVRDGLVDYATIQADPEGLNDLVATIAALDPATLSDADRKAFWLNAYNILVIKNVVDHYPIESPLAVSGFFDGDQFTVGGESFTLDGLEKATLYPAFPDARLHFALVCAAIGCPVLVQEAYRGDQLDEQLEAKTRRSLNNPQHVRVDEAAEQVALSELFTWYESDFTQDAETVIAFINRYRDEPVPASFETTTISYDWQLNDVKKKSPDGR